MKLTYRGVTYEHEQTTIEYREGEIGGHYRGQQWHYRYPRHIPQLPAKLDRQYRGVTYSTRSIPFEQNIFVEDSTTLGKCCPVALGKSRKIHVDKTSEIHLDNIRQNLERRLAVAKAKGDQTLISLLEKESNELLMNR